MNESSWKNGLPPVGEVCEATWGSKSAYCECIYHDKTHRGQPIFEVTISGSVRCEDDAEFRPLKPKAELKREKAVEDIAEIIDCIKTRHAAELVYDAGYRKVNELADEQINNHIDANSPLCSDGEKLMFRVGAKWARSQIMGEES